jgi:hypothetical protein
MFTAQRTDATPEAANATQAPGAAAAAGQSSQAQAPLTQRPADDALALRAPHRSAAESHRAGEELDPADRGSQGGSNGLLPMVAYPMRRQEKAASKARPSRALNLPRHSTSVAMTSQSMVTTSHDTVRTREPHRPGVVLTKNERIRLQVMQVQIRLASLSLYEGPIDGILSPETITGVRYFQTLKGMRNTGTLAAGTLSALDVPPLV